MDEEDNKMQDGSNEVEGAHVNGVEDNQVNEVPEKKAKRNTRIF